MGQNGPKMRFSNHLSTNTTKWSNTLKQLFEFEVTFYEKLIFRIFVFFPQKLQYYTSLKQGKKILCWAFLVRGGSKWALNEVYQVLSKVRQWNFSNFLLGVTVARRPKMIFLEITLFWTFWAKMFQIFTKVNAWYFPGRLFALSYSSIKT